MELKSSFINLTCVVNWTELYLMSYVCASLSSLGHVNYTCQSEEQERGRTGLYKRDRSYRSLASIYNFKILNWWYLGRVKTNI